jgi:hypothetical protein
MRARESLWDNIKAVTSDPYNLLVHTIDLGVVFCALHGCGVFLNGEDLFPAPFSRERNGVSAYAGECVNDDILLFGHCFRYVHRDCTRNYQ